MAFIQTELDAGTTFAQVAETERNMGNWERADHNIGLARQARDEARRRIEECERAESPEAFDVAMQKLESLDRLIEEFPTLGQR